MFTLLKCCIVGGANRSYSVRADATCHISTINASNIIAHRLPLACQISYLLLELFLCEDHSGHDLLVLFFTLQAHLLLLAQLGQQLLYEALLILAHTFHHLLSLIGV